MADGVHGKIGDNVLPLVDKASTPELDSVIGRQLLEVVLRAPVTLLRPSLAL